MGPVFGGIEGRAIPDLEITNVSLLFAIGLTTFGDYLYTPQHGGKIERFWQTLETTTGHSHEEATVANFIHQDNIVCKHSGLEITLQAARDGIPRRDQPAP
jgi:hypothetical protein